jgi:hypothetical protein
VQGADVRNIQGFISLAGAAAVIGLSGNSAAESSHSYRLSCHAVGNSPAEPLGDREGHALTASQATCLVEGGPLDGGVQTGTVIWEWDGPNGVVISGMGVQRKPGATAVFALLEGKAALTVVDGKMTGTSISGRGVYRVATGSAASLQGKTYTYTIGSSGEPQNHWTVDIKLD